MSAPTTKSDVTCCTFTTHCTSPFQLLLAQAHLTLQCILLDFSDVLYRAKLSGGVLKGDGRNLGPTYVDDGEVR